MSTGQQQRLAETFVSLTDTLVEDFDLLDFLGLLAERASELLEVDAAGVILSDQRGGWQPTAASSEAAELVELFATQTAEGPCQECVRSGHAVASSDLADDRPRWPGFTDRALQAGFRAAAAVPMRSHHQIIGSLTLLNTEADGIDQPNLQLAQALADMATVGILQQHSSRREDILAEQLQAALHHRVVIEQAKGVLAEHGRMSMQAAFELLRDYSRDNNQHLSELARSIATGTSNPRALLAHRNDPTINH